MISYPLSDPVIKKADFAAVTLRPIYANYLCYDWLSSSNVR